MMLAILLAILFTASAWAADIPVIFSWQANQEQDIAGYKLYQSAVPGQYGAPTATIQGAPTYTMTVPQTDVDQTLFFVLTAYDVAGNESAKSKEVSKVIPALPPVIVPPIEPPVIPPVDPPVEPPIIAASIPTPQLKLTPASPTSLIVTMEAPIDPSYTVDLRMGATPIAWGTAPSQVCPAFPCTITGLSAGTSYDVQAVAYTGTLNAGAVFGTISQPVSARTLPAPPPATAGLKVVRTTDTQAVITAPISALCKSLTYSRNGSTATTLRMTVTCVK